MATPTTTFTWAVSRMERLLASGAVTSVHYKVSASDGTYSSSEYGEIGLDQAEDDSELTPYADLTQSWAISAIQSKLGGADKVAEIQAGLQAQIDKQRTPDTGSGVPW